MEAQIRRARPDRAIAALAARQHGVVARRQLLAAGITKSMLEVRVRDRRLVRLHRGVYAFGHARLRREGHWLAAVLAVGPGAVLSHRDAAALHGLRSPSNSAVVEVATAADCRGNSRIRAYGRQSLGPRDVTVGKGVPVTTVARTLLDLAGAIPRHQLAKAFGEADRAGTLDVSAIAEVCERLRGRNGCGHAHLTWALTQHARLGACDTRSDLEDRFHALLAVHKLPRALANAQLDAGTVDALWPEQRVVVELDGYEFHRTRSAFQRDRTKANALVLAGYVVLRFTHADVVDRPNEVAVRLLAALRSCTTSARG